MADKGVSSEQQQVKANKRSYELELLQNLSKARDKLIWQVPLLATGIIAILFVKTSLYGAMVSAASPNVFLVIGLNLLAYVIVGLAFGRIVVLILKYVESFCAEHAYRCAGAYRPVESRE